MTDPGNAPKLIIDDDWKSQAQAEKEKLAQVESAKSSTGASGGSPGGAPAEGELPPADFRSLVGMLVTQAIMYLGGVADRKTGHPIFDPEAARFYIELLGTLETKTKGNLTEDEVRDLAGSLHELRLRYVELSDAVARQAAGSAGVRGIPGGPIGGSGAGVGGFRV